VVDHSPASHTKEITMTIILATVMATTVFVLVTTAAMAQTQPAPTLGEMKSAIEQQANQEKQATKEAVQAEKAKAEQAVAGEKQKAKEMVESKKSKATAKAAEQQQRAKDVAAQKKGKAESMAAE
jgi:F0F1-type ATP synthase membrane subunit b/b'